MIDYRSDLPTAAFITLAQRIWPRPYDSHQAELALARTTNISAWDGPRLVGAVRLLTDGYFFATIPELLVDPDYQRRGIGRELVRRIVQLAPKGKVFFGAQEQAVGFFERIGCARGPIGFLAAAGQTGSIHGAT